MDGIVCVSSELFKIKSYKKRLTSWNKYSCILSSGFAVASDHISTRC